MPTGKRAQALSFLRKEGVTLAATSSGRAGPPWDVVNHSVLLLAENGDRGCLRSGLAVLGSGWISAQNQRSTLCWQVWVPQLLWPRAPEVGCPLPGALLLWVLPCPFYSWALLSEIIQ